MTAAYVGRRVLHAVVVLWLAYTVVFLAVTLLPSDPVTALAGQMSDGAGIDPAVVAEMQEYYGYDQHPVMRYFAQLAAVLQGDFGYSIATGQTVGQRIGSALPSTLMLSVLAFGVAIVITGVVAWGAYLTKFGFIGRCVRLIPPISGSVPPFWVGIVVVQILSFQLGLMSIFPDGSLMSELVPAIVLGIPLSAALSQVLLESVDASYRQDFVQVVRAKGASERWLFCRHILQNASAPTVTAAANTLGLLVSGAVVTETIFSRSGVGSVLEQAVSTQDLALVQGFVLITATGFVVVNLAVDLIYPLLDPRIVGSAEVSQ